MKPTRRAARATSKSLDRGDIARDGDAARAVQARDDHGARQAAFDEERLRLLGAEGEGGHRALPPRAALQGAAAADHLDRLLEAERPAGPRRGHLAHAVAEHHGRGDPARAQHFGEPDLHREERGLRDLGAVESPRAVAARELVEQGEVGEVLEDLLDRLHRRSEGRVLLEKAPPHALPLRAVARVDEGDRGVLRESRGRDHPFAARLPCRERREHRGHQARRPAEGHGTMLVPLAMHGGGPCDVVETRSPGRPEVGGQVPGRGPECLRGAPAHHERQRGLLVGVRAPRADRGDLLRRAREDHVGVGSAEPEGVDADHQRAVGAQPHRRRHHAQVQFVEGDVRVERLDVERGGHFAVANAMHRLHEPGEPRGGLEVAEVALHGADQQGGACGPAPPEGLAERGRLHRIADRGSGAMRLDVVDIGRADAGALVSLEQQAGLRGAARHGDPRLASVGVDRRARDHGEHGIAVGERLVEILEQHDRPALRAHVAVAPGAEGGTVAAPRKHGGLGKGDEAERVHVQAHAAGQGEPAFAGGDRLAGLVEGDERRGAGGVDRHARPVEVEDVGDPVGRDARGVAGCDRRIDRPEVVGKAVGVVRRGNADEDAATAAAQAARADAAVLQRLPGELQQQALLRIHLRRLSRRNAEELGVEAPHVAERARREGVARPRVGTIGVEERLAGPAAGIDLAHQVAPREEVRPESIPGRPGEPERKRDDGNLVVQVGAPDLFQLMSNAFRGE